MKPSLLVFISPLHAHFSTVDTVQHTHTHTHTHTQLSWKTIVGQHCSLFINTQADICIPGEVVEGGFLPTQWCAWQRGWWGRTSPLPSPGRRTASAWPTRPAAWPPAEPLGPRCLRRKRQMLHFPSNVHQGNNFINPPEGKFLAAVENTGKK